MQAPAGIGAMIRGHRARTRQTRAEFAQLLAQACGEQYTEETIKNWEREKRLPAPRAHQGLSVVLETTLDAVMGAVAASKAWRLTSPGPQGDVLPDSEGMPDVQRRNFMAVVAAAAAAVGGVPDIAEARDGIDAALSVSDAGDIAYLEAVFERNAGGYHGRTPDTVLAQMRDDLVLLRTVLERPHRSADRATLARTAAGIAGLVAIIEHDRGQQQSAGKWFATAERAAQECGDRHMLAWALARHAMLPLNYGAPQAAARLAEQARAAAGTNPSAAKALAGAVAARARAGLGDHDGALEAIAATRRDVERLDAADASDTWFGYPLQKHHVHLSQAYTLLGRTAEAFVEQHAGLALTTGPSVMTRALFELDAAACHAADGDHRTAAATALTTWSRLPDGFGDGLLRSRTEALRDRLTGPARKHVTEILST
ncbi:transcriptional regulator [Streptomyces puniciscabiei]